MTPFRPALGHKQAQRPKNLSQGGAPVKPFLLTPIVAALPSYTEQPPDAAGVFWLVKGSPGLLRTVKMQRW
jgi:hypothetical protein